MYRKQVYAGTTIHLYDFDSEAYKWTIEIGQRDKLETLTQIAPGADCIINWSVFDWDKGKDGYGRIQNGSDVIQGSSANHPTVSFTDGKLQKGEFPIASPGFMSWRILVQKGKVKLEYVYIGDGNSKNARTAIGQLKNGNIVFIAVEKPGLTVKEFANFCTFIGCEFACDADGGGSTSMYADGGYKYNQGRAIAGAMVARRKTLVEMCLPKAGCGYVWGAQGEVLTKEGLAQLVKWFGREHYYYENTSAEKWLGMQVFDCSGLVVWAGLKMGILTQDYTAAGLYEICDKIDKPEYGCLCFNNNLSHVGIYIGDDKYLHAKMTSAGVVITDKYNFVKFGKLKGAGNMDWNEKNKAFVKKVQQIIGTDADGFAGDATNKAFDDYAARNKYTTNNIEFVRHVQRELNLSMDGIAGTITYTAFADLLNGQSDDKIKRAWLAFLEAVK